MAARAVAVEKARAELQRAMLAGVLPPHAVPFAELTGDGERKYTRSWDGLSVLQVRMHTAAQTAATAFDFSPVAAAWRDIAATVNCVGEGMLEMVQATGDAFLVAGPFVEGATDEHKHAAAQCTVRLLCELHALLQGKCTFTAVATAGSAYGALLGASLLTFRLFGAAVRESNALLAEVPRPIGLPRDIALAAESFRRQEGNYGVAPPSGRFFGMSYGLGPGASAAQIFDATISAPRSVGTYGARSQWRVKGLGATAVSLINLTSHGVAENAPGVIEGFP
jgi:hypothetical protein